MFQAADAASLLRLYLNFDLLEAAAELVLEYIDALLGRGHQYFGIEVILHIKLKYSTYSETSRTQIVVEDDIDTPVTSFDQV